jgi:hypothetical protein
MICVHLRVPLPFLWQIVGSENRRYRANRDASATVDTLDRVYIKLQLNPKILLILPWMNAVNRTPNSPAVTRRSLPFAANPLGAVQGQRIYLVRSAVDGLQEGQPIQEIFSFQP